MRRCLCDDKDLSKIHFNADWASQIACLLGGLRTFLWKLNS